MLILIGPRSIYGNKGALEHLKDSVRFTEEQVGQSICREFSFKDTEYFLEFPGGA